MFRKITAIGMALSLVCLTAAGCGSSADDTVYNAGQRDSCFDGIFPVSAGGYFREVIEPGAIDGLTDLKDVPLLVGHDMKMIPLARSRNNNPNSTMQLTPASEGLDMRADVDAENNATARALYSACGRGDVTGMSFAFFADKERWEDLDTDYPLRHIEHFSRILEVSAVTFPAYNGSSISAGRDEESSLESARSSLESARNALKEERERQKNDERRNKALAILRR